jgi:hypothetical protein
METLTYTESTNLGSETPMTNLTTYQNSTDNEPYMFAMTWVKPSFSTCSVPATMKAYLHTQKNNHSAKTT